MNTSGWLLVRALTGTHASAPPDGWADFIVALSFGLQLDSHGRNVPGPVNEQLAAAVRDNAGDLPLVLQGEVADALLGDDPPGNRRGVVEVRQHRRPGEYLDTREVLEQAVAAAVAHGWRRALVVAHPCHLPRVEAELDRLGLAHAPAPGLLVRWDRQSAQPWTRSPLRWLAHEALAWGLCRLRRR